MKQKNHLSLIHLFILTPILQDKYLQPCTNPLSNKHNQPNSHKNYQNKNSQPSISSNPLGILKPARPIAQPNLRVSIPRRHLIHPVLSPPIQQNRFALAHMVKEISIPPARTRSLKIAIHSALND